MAGIDDTVITVSLPQNLTDWIVAESMRTGLSAEDYVLKRTYSLPSTLQHADMKETPGPEVQITKI